MHLPSARRFDSLFIRSAATLLASAALLSSCDGKGTTSSPAPVVPDTKVTVHASKSDAVMMVRTPTAARGERGGTTLQLDAAVFNPQGMELEHKTHIYWTSLDTMVVAVDPSGLVTAQDVGSTWVVVDHKKGVDSVSVEVIPVPVASVAMTGPDSLSLDDTASFTATPLDSAGVPLEGRVVSWSSLAPAVAGVSESGEVIALALGSTEISATVEEESASQLLQVWPQPVASVVVEPAAVSVPQFHKVKFTATAYDRRGKVLEGRAVSWSSSDPVVFYIKANADTAAGKDVGEAVVTATMEGKTGESAVTVTNPVEARALWVTRFEYTGASSVDFAKIATIFQKAASANFNVVYFQVRTSGDALYFSDIEPCSPRMCRTLGGTRPAQDPLVVALTEAKKYGIEVHAWLNAYTGFIAGALPSTACSQFIASTPANWLKAHPEWSASTKNFSTGVITRQVDNCTAQTEYMWISPGVPEVRAQLARVSADIARRYGPLGLKGIHLDRIRYSGNTVSYDQPSQDAFKAATGNFPTSNAQASWLNFRRGFVNQGVKDVRDSVAAVDPAMVISAAVFPGYQPRAGWVAQWSYTDLFQDPQAWAQGGYLDVEVPMNYPATAASASWTVKAYCSNTDWTCVLDDHIQRIEKGAGRQVYVGVGAIKGWDEMAKQIDLAHDRSATGMSVYSYSQIDVIPNNAWAQLAAGPFKHKATLPAMSWK
ncbi:MAG TPA: family 10 glycosylhydrolase [Gemmatimonadaceae bacterium]|nr:family 10 glycosylhydrolase [Gemmatimonadaceae bacterium]